MPAPSRSVPSPLTCTPPARSGRYAPRCTTCAPTSGSCRTIIPGPRSPSRPPAWCGSPCSTAPTSRLHRAPVDSSRRRNTPSRWSKDSDLRTLYLYQPGDQRPARPAEQARGGHAACSRCRTSAGAGDGHGHHPGRRPQPAQAGLPRAPLSALVSTSCGAPAGAPGRGPARRQAAAHAVRGGAGRPRAPRHARRLGSRLPAQPAHRGPLFRQELGTTFVQWRQQVLLAKALSHGRPQGAHGHHRGRAGLRQPQRLPAMVRRSVGAPPASSSSEPVKADTP
jgi:hypothetical protein